jgi:hypothetical protein
MANNRDDFSQSTIETIASRVGYKCSYPSCGADTRGPSSNSLKRISLGEAAHITGASPDGPRYDSNLTSEQRKSQENGIWLCKKHARIIDVDVANYPVQLLRYWKKLAEFKQYCALTGFKYECMNSRTKEALRAIDKSITNLQNIYDNFKLYYDTNFCMCHNFIEVWNLITETPTLYQRPLSDAYNELGESREKFNSNYLEYKLDIGPELDKYIKEYFKLIEFTYQSDGETGLYNNYWEAFFENLIGNYDKMKKITDEISKIIQMKYSV